MDPGTLLCSTCDKPGHVAEVFPRTHEFLRYGSRSSSLNRSRRASAGAKSRTPYTQEQKTGYPGTNWRSSTPGPPTRTLPREGDSTALLAFNAVGQPESPPPSKTQDPKQALCFHAKLPVKNNLKMLKVCTWAKKYEVPSRWLLQGVTVLVVCNTVCTKTLGF